VEEGKGGIYILTTGFYKDNEKKIYTENIQTCAFNNRATTYLGLFQGDEGLYGKPWDADP